AGSLAYHVAPGARSIVAVNQAMVLGRPVDDPLVQAVTNEAFRRYARYWFDAFDVVDWSDDRIDAAFAWNGIENLADPVAGGPGGRAGRRPRSDRTWRRGRDVRRAPQAAGRSRPARALERRADRRRVDLRDADRLALRPAPARGRAEDREPSRGRGGDHQGDRPRVRAGDLRTAAGLAPVPAWLVRPGRNVRIALACPYAWDDAG